MLVCSCGRRQTRGRQYIKQLGYSDEYHERFPLVGITDGGSAPVPFLTMQGDIKQLVLDKALRDDSTTNMLPEKGHLYWGYEKIGKGQPIDYDSELATELFQAMCEYLAEHSFPSSQYSRLRPFLDKIMLERNKSFKASLESEQSPAGDVQ
jgi:hypothetical protein